jgi:hypothetical protein
MFCHIVLRPVVRCFTYARAEFRLSLKRVNKRGSPIATGDGGLQSPAIDRIAVRMCYPFTFETHHWSVDMRDSEKAAKIIEALKAAEREPAQTALPILNGLVGLVQASGEQPLEVEEARSSAFLAICEIGKALHRGQPVDQLWTKAIGATERWMSLAR